MRFRVVARLAHTLRGRYVPGMAQFHWDPASYLDLMRREVPDYERLQDKTVGATGIGATRILDLGTGTGETARRMLARHAAAVLIGLDSSDEMLERARAVLPSDRVELHVARLEDPLPPGPFDVVVSALAIHHLDGNAKAGTHGVTARGTRGDRHGSRRRPAASHRRWVAAHGSPSAGHADRWR